MSDEGKMCEFRRARPVAIAGRTLVMGIVNMTPDSFSGRNAAVETAPAVGLAMEILASGADMVDIGAESSRPGSEALDWRRETDRLGDAVARLRKKTDAPISVDTYHPETAQYVLNQGADIINDITALRGGWDAADSAGERMREAVAREGAVAILMHMKGAPGKMQENPAYTDVVREVMKHLEERIAFARKGGVDAGRIWLDPGFGFGKDFQHNRALLLALDRLNGLGCPLLAGLSRKRMIGDALGLPVDDRLEGSLALAVVAVMNGAAIIRAHDVPQTVRAVRMADAVRFGLGRYTEATLRAGVPIP